MEKRRVCIIFVHDPGSNNYSNYLKKKKKKKKERAKDSGEGKKNKD